MFGGPDRAGWNSGHFGVIAVWLACVIVSKNLRVCNIIDRLVLWFGNVYITCCLV